MMGLNLHGLVRRVIGSVHPDETVTVYQSIGQVNDRGQLRPLYAAPVRLAAQIQSINDDALGHADRTGQTAQTRRAWLTDLPRPITTIDRGAGRGGDMVQRADGSWWLVDAVTEDYRAAGWVSVRLTRQIEAPDFRVCSWWKDAP